MAKLFLNDDLPIENIWCPLSRVSIHCMEYENENNGQKKIHAVPTGAFNIVRYGSRINDNTPYPAMNCMGRICPFYRPRYFKWGHCALSHDNHHTGVWVFLGLVILEAAIFFDYLV